MCWLKSCVSLTWYEHKAKFITRLPAIHLDLCSRFIRYMTNTHFDPNCVMLFYWHHPSLWSFWPMSLIPLMWSWMLGEHSIDRHAWCGFPMEMILIFYFPDLCGLLLSSFNSCVWPYLSAYKMYDSHTCHFWHRITGYFKFENGKRY